MSAFHVDSTGDATVRASSLQTGVFSGPIGTPIGQLRFNPANRVREEQAAEQLYVPLYGYFEIRAKAVASPINHVALCMIGFEDEPERSGEICTWEIMGGFISPASSRIGYGIHPWGDPNLKDEFSEDFLPVDSTCFHTYAAEWTPNHVDFFLDNRLVRRIRQSPTYPMQFMLGIYERPGIPLGTSSRQPSYPKRFIVDYFRAYQPLEATNSLN
jgi:beta-glucanase (GH16 family)